MPTTSRPNHNEEAYTIRGEAQILRPEQVAALPKTKALLFSSGASPVTLTLKPWYTERDADQITDDNQTATGEVTAAAITYLGPRNPLAQALQHTGPVEAPSL